MDINFGIWSLIPPILAVALAFLTKNVILSLFVSLFSGCLILAYGNPWTALQTTFSDYLFVDMTSGSNAQTIVLMAVIGGFVALVEKSGGARAFARAISNKLTKPVSAQIACWLGGLAIYFSDSGNSLILGPIFRPVFDKLKVSRAKLSYILDSTSSPVCILVPITGWGVYIMGLIQAEFDNLGVADSDYTTFVQAIPFQLYAILAILMIPLVAFTHKDFSLMKKAEEQAAANDYSFEDSLSTADESTADAYSLQNAKPTMVILPIIVVFATLFITLAPQGFPFKKVGGNDFRVALTMGYLFGALVLMLLIRVFRVMDFKKTFKIYVDGMKSMTDVAITLVLAWSLGSMISGLGTASFIVDGLQSLNFSPVLVPAAIFLFGAFVSFSTGSSWGTFAIMMPLAIPMAHAFAIPYAIAAGAVLSGGLFGDHCSPISDTTIMASAGAHCSHVNHVSTQLPYAITAASCAAVCYVITGIAQAFLGANGSLFTSLILLAVAIAVELVVLSVIRVRTNKKAAE